MTLRWLFLGATACLVLLLTLAPTSSQPESLGRCLLCNPRLLADGIANIGLFVPFGLALGLLGASATAAVAVGGLLSGVIELVQSSVPGRDGTLIDFVANTMGAGIGAWAVHLVRRSVMAPAAGRDWLALIGAGAACVAWIATGSLMAPSWSPSDYWGQWTPVLESLEPYQGEILAATVGEMSVASHRVGDSARLRAALSARAPVQVDLLVGPPPTRVSSIFSIADAEAERVLLVGASRRDLVFGYRMRAADWRLDQPDLRLAGAFDAVAPGHRTTILIARRAHDYCVRVGQDETCGVGLGAGDGWSLLLSARGFPPAWRVRLGFLWMAALAAPAGFFASGRRRTILAVTAMIACLLLLPALTEVRPTRLHEWGGVLAGLGSGALLARVIGRRPRAVTSLEP
jgi:VanZ like family